MYSTNRLEEIRETYCMLNHNSPDLEPNLSKGGSDLQQPRLICEERDRNLDIL